MIDHCFRQRENCQNSVLKLVFLPLLFEVVVVALALVVLVVVVVVVVLEVEGEIVIVVVVGAAYVKD